MPPRRRAFIKTRKGDHLTLFLLAWLNGDLHQSDAKTNLGRAASWYIIKPVAGKTTRTCMEPTSTPQYSEIGLFRHFRICSTKEHFLVDELWHHS